MEDGFEVLAKRASELVAASTLLIELVEGGARDVETRALMDDLRAGLAQGMPLLSRAVETLAEMGDAPIGVPTTSADGSVSIGTLGDVLALHDKVAHALSRCDAAVGPAATTALPPPPPPRAQRTTAPRDLEIADVEEAIAVLEKHRLACVEAAWAGASDTYVEIPDEVSSIASAQSDARDYEFLIVLDVDHTLGEFMVDGNGSMRLYPRPHVNDFLATCAKLGCAIVLWSHTKETELLRRKVVELVAHARRAGSARPAWRLELVAGRGLSLFVPVHGAGADGGRGAMAHAKPLSVLWDHPRFGGRFGSHNTLHVDDTLTNFVFNMENGLVVRRFQHDDPGAASDDELALLARYLRRVVAGVVAESRGAHEWDHRAWRRELLMAEAEERLEGEMAR